MWKVNIVNECGCGKKVDRSYSSRIGLKYMR
jgi:hypothetical protein